MSDGIRDFGGGMPAAKPTAPLRPQSAEQIIVCEPDFSSKWEATRNYCLSIKGITIFRGLEANCQWMKEQIETAFAEARARAAGEREQARNLFWPPEDEFEEHIYEIRNGKTADYVRAHALALAGTFAGVGESPAAAPAAPLPQESK